MRSHLRKLDNKQGTCVIGQDSWEEERAAEALSCGPRAVSRACMYVPVAGFGTYVLLTKYFKTS